MKARRKWPIFHMLKEKKYPPQNPVSNKNILQKCRRNQEILRQKTTKTIYIYSKRVATDFLTRKEFWNIKKEEQKEYKYG